MPAGTSLIDREGRSGSKYDTYKEYYDADGNLVERVLSHKSTYRAISTIIHKGPDLPVSTIPDIPSEDDPVSGGSIQIPDEEPAPDESDEDDIIVVG